MNVSSFPELTTNIDENQIFQIKNDTIDKSLDRDFKESNLWMLVIGANLVIWIAGYFDYIALGLREDWILFRFAYMPLSIALSLSTKNGYFLGKKELPTIICATYATFFLLTLISWTGFHLSHLLHGPAQVILAMAVTPVRPKIFFPFLLLQLLATIWTMCVQDGYFDIERVGHIGSFCTNYFLASFIFISNYILRKKTYNSLSDLHVERFRQSHLVEKQALALTRAQVAMALQRTTQMLAHDIRRPFSLIKITLDLLGKSNELDQIKSIISRTNPTIQRSISAVNAMLEDIVSIDSEKKQLKKEIPLGLIIRESLDSVDLPASIELRIEYNHKNLVFVDENQISRVIINIVNNALQALSNDIGKIYITTEEKDNFAIIKIRNTGSYISNTNMTHIFDAFYTSKKSGTGLGLAICKRLVESNGGKINCVSEPGNSESTSYVEFTFSLPIRNY